jgi:transposase
LTILTGFRITFKFLPAYSPHLNPIEEFFGELKANYRSIHPNPQSREEIKTE